MRKDFVVNENGYLVHGGCDTVALAKEYGTPLYVLNEQEIRDRCRRVRSGFMDKYPNTQVLYASKAFSSITMYRIIKEEGLGLDVVSGGELYTAIKAEFPMEKVYFHGNNKTVEEIELGIDNNVGCFVIDNEAEMACIQALAMEKGKIVKALLRITPGVYGHTHEYMSTGQIDSKFGFALHNDVVEDAVRKVLQYPNIHFAGSHCHIGSQLYKKEAYTEAVKVMMTLVQTIKNDFGIEIEELNMGGGFGVYDIDANKHTDIIVFTEEIMQSITLQCQLLQLKMPKILIEPGRWIAAESGITLYTVGSVKHIEGVRKYVSVDGGMTDNPRRALYQAAYQAVIANKAAEKPKEVVTIAGRCCESGDILISKIKLAEAQVGDIVAVFGTGAYNYSMASNYNRLRKPAVVMVNNGTSKVAIRRESYEDLIRNEI
jgi:diaminopimelate decarboxylase